jgi:hypothetical protein
VAGYRDQTIQARNLPLPPLLPPELLAVLIGLLLEESVRSLEQLHDGIVRPIAYSVEGLPNKRGCGNLDDAAGEWRAIRDVWVEFDQGKLYLSAEKAIAALKSWIEGGEKPPKAKD